MSDGSVGALIQSREGFNVDSDGKKRRRISSGVPSSGAERAAVEVSPVGSGSGAAVVSSTAREEERGGTLKAEAGSSMIGTSMSSDDGGARRPSTLLGELGCDS